MASSSGNRTPLSEGLVQLKESISGCKYNTTLMLSRLQRFEDRLSNIEYRMRPISQATESYSKAKQNISVTLDEVSKTYDYFRIANEVKVIINQGYKPSTQKQFFSALGRLSQAKKFFEDHKEIKSGGTVLMTIENLLRNAVMQCVSELERLLVPLGKTVEFNVEEGRYVVINPLSNAVAAEIKSLFALFDKHNQKIHYEVYQGVRIAQVIAELHTEESEHESEWAALMEDVPYSKGSHPLQAYLALAYEMLRGELQLWSSALDPSNPLAAVVFAAICDSTVMEVQRLLTPMLLGEDEISSSSFIIRQTNAFLIRLDMLDMFMARYEELVEICRPDVTHPTAASVHLEGLRNAMVEACVESINLLLQSSADPGDPLDLANRDDIKRAFKRGESVAIANPGELCDLHPITGNVLHCCEELGQFEPIYRRLCELVTEVGVTSFPYMYAAELRDLVTSLVVDNLHDALLQRADRYDVARPPPEMAGRTGGGWSLFGGGKSATSGDGTSRSLQLDQSKLYDGAAGAADALALLCNARRHLFLANNLYSLCVYCRDSQRAQEDYISAIESSSSKQSMPMQVVVVNDLPNFLSVVETELHEAQDAFCQCVVVALGLSQDDLLEAREQLESAKKRGDKKASERVLKAKFSVFNSGMDALLGQQGEWRVTSAELRSQMGNALVQRIVPVWTNFFGTHSATPFSKKHMKEYLRFPPHDVTNILAHFFG